MSASISRSDRVSVSQLPAMDAALCFTIPHSLSPPPLLQANPPFPTSPTFIRWPGSSVKYGNVGLSPQHMMFRNTAALILRNMVQRPRAEPENKREDPDTGTESGVEAEGFEDGGDDSEEELVCLEEEAMGGHDEGRAPTDYERRAHIFDKSSRMLQARKDRSARH